MTDSTDISVKQATEELLQTSIFRNIAKRNNIGFAKKLAIWLVRYILVISSMNESLQINLEQILMNLHGNRFKKIVEITEKGFQSSNQKETRAYDHYIW
jgi:hypothetical protein